MKIETIPPQPTVITARFELRPLRASDVGLIEFYTREERVARQTTSIPHSLPPGATEAYVKRAMSSDRDADVWAIDATRDGGSEVIGLVSLARLSRNQSELGYWVVPAFWNQGVASEVATAVIDANPMGHDTIFAAVFQDNPASARVLTNCGFEYIGDAEAFSVARNAKVPTWTYLRKFAKGRSK
jgi:RimJ/RimL family protein N-acetyltransferase